MFLLHAVAAVEGAPPFDTSLVPAEGRAGFIGVHPRLRYLCVLGNLCDRSDVPSRGRLGYTFFRLFAFPRLRGDDISFG